MTDYIDHTDTIARHHAAVIDRVRDMEHRAGVAAMRGETYAAGEWERAADILALDTFGIDAGALLQMVGTVTAIATVTAMGSAS